MLLLLASNVFSADCVDVFPDGASNSRGGGKITLANGSKIIGSPDNILDSKHFNDNSGSATNSCDVTNCSTSNAASSSGDYNTFPGGSNVTVAYNSIVTLSPGDYNSLSTNFLSVLNLTPGVYTFFSNVSFGSSSTINIVGSGSVLIYVNGKVSVSSSAVINTPVANGRLFLFARDNIVLGANSSVSAVIYSKKNINLNNGSHVVGAVTSNKNITLSSASFITYDAVAVSDTDFNGFCNAALPLPSPIAEWRLDENSWAGTTNEVQDISGNNLHGRAVNANALPTTNNTVPALSSSPGTCGYGEFDGTADGYVQIDDPGSNSILDLNSEFTVATWVYPKSLPSGSNLATIVSKDENFEYHLNSSGRIYWWWRGSGTHTLTSTSALTLNSWQHVAIAFKNGMQTIYINGVASGSSTSGSDADANNDPVFIGVDLNFLSRRFNGWIDEVKIYDSYLVASQIGEVMAQRHDCNVSPSLDHFVIDTNGATASVCTPQEISLSARDSADNVLTSYVGTIALTTSTNKGNWENTANAADALGSLTNLGGSDDGNAQYVFEASAGDRGTVKLSLANQHAQTVSILVSDSSAGVSSSSSNLTFSENIFQVNENDNLDLDVIAGRRHQFTVSLVRRDPDTSECGVADTYNNGAGVKSWLLRSAADPGGQAPVMNNADLSDAQALPDSQPGANNITLNFVSGVAGFSLDSSDVGQYSISFLDDSSGFSDTNISGSSSTLSVRPFAFDLSIAANPAAVDEDGGVFVAAGTDFSVQARAVAWQAADDSNDDGIADGHDDTDPSNNSHLANNDVLPSFGAESPAAQVILSSTLWAPAAGSDPGLASSAAAVDARLLSAFTSGVASTSEVYFDEVGIIEINALIDGTYLASPGSAKALGASGTVGRFMAQNFVLTNSAVANACDSFNYMEQPFSVSYTLEARSARNSLMDNYQGSYAKLDSAGTISIGAIDGELPTPLSSRINTIGSSFSWLNGVGDFVSDIVFLRSGSGAENPFSQMSLGLNAVDSDGAAVTGFDLDSDNSGVDDSVELGQTAVRYGRLRLDNSFGPETADLPVKLTTEYWSSGWLQNAADNCTALNASSISYPAGTIDILANRTVTVGAGTSTGIYGDDSGGNVNFFAGDAGHLFTAPGATHTGSFDVDVDLTLYPWLRFDWNGDGIDDLALPSAEFTFGSYRGHDRIIYWQERLD